MYRDDKPPERADRPQQPRETGQQPRREPQPQRDIGREFERMSADGAPLYVEVIERLYDGRPDLAIDVMARWGATVRIAYFLARLHFSYRRAPLAARKLLGFDLVRDLYQSLKYQCRDLALKPSAHTWDIEDLESFLFEPRPDRRGPEQRLEPQAQMPPAQKPPLQPAVDQRPVPTTEREQGERRGRGRRGGRGPRPFVDQGDQGRAKAQAPAPTSPEPHESVPTPDTRVGDEESPQGDTPATPEAEQQ